MNAAPPTFQTAPVQTQLPQFNVSTIQASMVPPQQMAPLLATQMPLPPSLQAQGQEAQGTPEKKSRKRKGVDDPNQPSASEKKARKEQDRERKAEEKAAKQREKERKAAERLEKLANKAREKAAKAEQQAEKRKTSKEAKEKKNQQAASTPKKPPTTPALVFKAKIKASLREQNPSASSAEIDQIITAKWKELPEEERKIYREERDKALAAYHQQCEEKGIPVEKKVKPKKKKEKDGGDKGNLKRPTSAFLYFLKDAMAQLKVEYPSGGRKELLTLASQRWGSLAPEKKIPYEEQAKVSQQRYAEAKKALEAQNAGSNPPDPSASAAVDDDDDDDDEDGEADHVNPAEHEDDDDEENESDTE